MTKKQKRHHDNFFRTVFSNPKNAASLLTLASKSKLFSQAKLISQKNTHKQVPCHCEA